MNNHQHDIPPVITVLLYALALLVTAVTTLLLAITWQVLSSPTP